MAHFSCRNLKFFSVCSLFLAVVVVAAAADTAPAQLPSHVKKESLVARFQIGDMTKCWESLTELHACTGEVVLFFINGEANLGPGCCAAIRFIEHQCWSSMLTSLGFTAEEGRIMTRYCDASYADARAP